MLKIMLAILTTHPIQYQVPLWRELARRGEISFEVWYLSDHGHRVGFDRGFGKAFSWDLDMLAGYPYRFLETWPPKADIAKFRGARICSLAPLFQKQNVTALLINGWHPQAYWQATFQAHRAGIPVLLRGETNDLRRVPRWKDIVKRPLLRLLFQRVSVFLTIGIANRRFYQKHDIPDSRLIFTPYCVDNERFSNAAETFRLQRYTLRDMWGIPQNGVCFLFCGKLIAKKRFQDVLRAFDVLLTRGTSCNLKSSIHLLAVGDGALRTALEVEAHTLEQKVGRPCVTFTGFLNQTEIPKAYATADCLILPSDAGETWGLVVNEAMASGLPAIVSDQVGCGPDLIDPGVTGEIFPMGDVGCLADAMAAWSDVKRCHSVRPAMQRKISQYSVERAVDGILEGLDAVCHSRCPSIQGNHALASFEDRGS